MMKLMLCTLLFTSTIAFADEDAAGIVTEISAKDPKVTDIAVVNGDKTFRAAVGDSLQESDHVQTPAGVSVTITLADDSQLTVGPGSDIEIKDVISVTKGTTLKLITGYIHLLVKKVYSDEKPFVVETKTSAMGVRGTEFVVEDQGGTASVHTLEGKVAFAPSREALRTAGAHEMVAAGFSSKMQAGAQHPEHASQFNRGEFMHQMQNRAPLFHNMMQQANQRASFHQQMQQGPGHHQGHGPGPGQGQHGQGPRGEGGRDAPQKGGGFGGPGGQQRPNFQPPHPGGGGPGARPGGGGPPPGRGGPPPGPRH